MSENDNHPQEYTPSEGEVREYWGMGAAMIGSTFAEGCAQFDRFLAEVRAEAVEDFVDGMSTSYKRHSAEAITEDMEAAVTRFGVDATAAGWADHLSPSTPNPESDTPAIDRLLAKNGHAPLSEQLARVPVVATTGDPLPWFCPGCKQHMPARDARGHDGGGVVYSPRPEFGPVVIPEGDKA